jgi:tRNA(Ile)-lysidine synthetase-like protein
MTIGKGTVLLCRYDEAVFRVPGGKTRMGSGAWGRIRMDRPGRYALPGARAGKGSETGGTAAITWEGKGRFRAAGLKRLAEGERAAAFDADEIRMPLTVGPLRAGNRMRPFGLKAEKKVKEILIDGKVPREERWGRPVVCDADGRILWIPGVVRSASAPVTPETRRTVILRALPRVAEPA